MATRAEKLAFAQTMVETLQSALSTGATVMSVSVDGNYTQFNRAQAIQELEYWQKQVIRYSRATRGRTSTIRLDNAGSP